MALFPQIPVHGLIHLFLIHAFSAEHSVLNIHSGLHPLYGSPWYSGKQLHKPSTHFVLGPHGEGLHGSILDGGFAIV